MLLKDVVCLVTGGASGLGLATVKRLLDNGAKVLAVDIQEDKGTKMAEQLGNNFTFVRADITSEEDITRAIATVLEKYGYINALVNSAGIAASEPCITNDGQCHSLDVFEKIMKVNTIGTFNVTRLVAKAMTSNVPNEEGERGVIVNVSSIASIESQAVFVAYGASKGAINGMALPLTRNLGKYGIRVMTIAPGFFDTPLSVGANPDPEVRAKIKITYSAPFPSRPGKPDEFAHLVQAIIENPMMNGEIVRIDGGFRTSQL